MKMRKRDAGAAGHDGVGGSLPQRRHRGADGKRKPRAGALLIETYSQAAEGYHPLLIRAGWQVAQLNYLPGLRISALRQMDRHLATDEVFISLKGAAVLIAAEETPAGLRFVALRMIRGVAYNIPAGRWHNIAMRPEDSVIIVERANTHREDCDCRKMTAPELRSVGSAVRAARQEGRG